ncbi:MAG: recombinase family protein [Mogibacterium sp.]|nr:recombinase family protein [Bacillota bacterium]MBR3201514.1 recombinase family protein [Mogibacterium sp.]
MARKSRKQTTSQSPTVVGAVKSETINTAIYARLSIENSGKDDDGDSIENQISFCKEYVSEHPYLNLVGVYEDNGKKGTNFDRPQFQKMMDEVKAGRIKCLVVKDLSRFSRDYIEAGAYLEKIFPFMGIRFISITDGYDSAVSGDAEKALMVPLKNMINTAYAKDISRKIITSFRSRQAKGEILPAFAPYGYVKSKTQAYRYEIDEETAPYVRMIFEWKAEGFSHREISEKLMAMGAVTPAMRKVQLGIWKAEKYKHTTWYGRTIIDILQNRTYTGCIVYGRMPKSLYEGIKMHRASPEEWRIIPDAHEPIVSQELFDKVQDMFAARKATYSKKCEVSKERRDSQENLFKGIIYCGDCGKRMRFVKSTSHKTRTTFVCGGYLDSTYQNCSRHAIWDEAVREAVAAVISEQVQIEADMEAVIKRLKGGVGERRLSDQYQGKVNNISLQLSKITEKKARLYENLVEGLLEEEDYQFAKKQYENEYQRLQIALDEARQAKDSFDKVMALNTDWMQAVKGLGNMDELSADVIKAMVARVSIFEGKRVQIDLKYQDKAAEVAAIVDALREADEHE